MIVRGMALIRSAFIALKVIPDGMTVNIPKVTPAFQTRAPFRTMLFVFFAFLCGLVSLR